MGKKLAVFDFDGTVTSKDSMLEFVRFVKGGGVVSSALMSLSPLIILSKFGLYPNDEVKKKFLRKTLGGTAIADIQEQITKFSKEVIPMIIRPKALEQLQFHKSRGHDVVIVSASLDFWVTPWPDRLGIPCICTKAEIKDGIITGELASPNCYGEEKVTRLKAEYDIDSYEMIFAYGDSRGDRELLRIAQRAYYKPFRGKLVRIEPMKG